MTTVKESEAADADAKRGDLMPLDFILDIMRDDSSPLSIRFEAAKAALPYCHPKLASIQDSGTDIISQEEALEQLR
jgi:hypothetical protein